MVADRVGGDAVRVEIILPWPPSVNRYWRTVRGRMLISREGRAYRLAVVDRIIRHRSLRIPCAGRLAVSIVASPPDRRRRDLDNLLKAPLDALAHADVYQDDEQIDSLTIERGPLVPDGELRVCVQEVPNG